MSDQLMSMTLWTLFHAMLRSDKVGTPEEKERARGACNWLTSELQQLKRYCTPEEAEIIGLIYNHWSKHHEAPSYKILKHNLSQGSNPVLEEHLREYEEQRNDLPRLFPADLPALLHTKTQEHCQETLNKILENAKIININGGKVTMPGRKEKVQLKGPTDAMNYLFAKMESGSLSGAGSTPTHGVFSDMTDYILEMYDKASDPSITAGRKILTGLRGIDERISLRKGMFVGLLGYGGHGKTRLGRTMVYNALLAGNNVMHFTFEQDLGEELNRYAIIHSHHPQWGTRIVDGREVSRGIDIKKLEDGSLTQAELNFLKHEVLPDIRDNKTLPGKLLIRQPTEGTNWDACKTQMLITDKQIPLDMIFMDYLAMVSTGRDHKEEMNQNIQDAKLLAMTFRGGEGVEFVTPIQANTEGWKEACKEKGRYEMNAIWMYSQFGRACDVILSVFDDDDLRDSKKVALGSVKHRRGANIPVFQASVIHEAGLFRDAAAKATEQSIDAAMDDL